MRTGSCAVQQGLTTEAASIVKQAVTLAKRRGHAQVTPLHVASTMLSITNGLLRTACLQSHSHPLQCKALELCFNVALNRLPATTTTSSNPMLGGGPHNHHSQCPSISNALVAAFKRAQAHQRRGSIENQQQPLLAVKIEIEQLIISILDDPSVSRVMREAGFNSTQVKSNVEQAVSLEICSSQNTNNNNDPSSKSKENKNNNNNNNNSIPTLIIGSDIRNVVSDQMIRDEDIESVVDSLKSSSTQRRSVVVVGECVDTLEGVVRGVLDKVEKGGVKFVSLSLADFGNVSRVEVDQKIEELKGLIAKRGSNGYVLYLGDLKWVFDYRARCSSGRVYNNYCPVDHLVNEIGKLVNSGVVGESGRFWVMGIATFQAYMRCKNEQPSLETLWGLHPITIPAGSLRLSLITDSGLQNQPTNKDKADKRTSWLLHEGVGDETQVRSLQSSACNSDSSTSSLPAWLQQYKNENKGINSYNDQNCVPVGELCKKWNSMCGSTQKQPHLCDKTLTLSSVVSPSSSTSGFSYEQHQQHSQSSDHNIIWISESTRITTSNNFKELNSENMKTLCNALEKKVPWQKEIIPEIVSTVLQCRSGLVRRKENNNNNKVKEDTWLLFQGADVEGKEKIARELARLVYGSHSNNFVSISLSSFASSTRSGDSSEDNIQCCRNKRTRDEPSYCSYIERFYDAVSSNPHRLFLVEDIEQADYCSQLGFKRAIERGRVEDSNGDELVGLCDAIIILSCESFSSRSRACSPNDDYSVKQSQSKEKEENGVSAALEETSTTSPCGSLDLNIPIDDDDGCDVEDRLVDDDIGLLEYVDRKVIFKIQEL